MLSTAFDPNVLLKKINSKLLDQQNQINIKS